MSVKQSLDYIEVKLTSEGKYPGAILLILTPNLENSLLIIFDRCTVAAFAAL